MEDFTKLIKYADAVSALENRQEILNKMAAFCLPIVQLFIARNNIDKTTMMTRLTDIILNGRQPETEDIRQIEQEICTIIPHSEDSSVWADKFSQPALLLCCDYLSYTISPKQKRLIQSVSLGFATICESFSIEFEDKEQDTGETIDDLLEIPFANSVLEVNRIGKKLLLNVY